MKTPRADASGAEPAVDYAGRIAGILRKEALQLKLRDAENVAVTDDGNEEEISEEEEIADGEGEINDGEGEIADAEGEDESDYKAWMRATADPSKMPSEMMP